MQLWFLFGANQNKLKKSQASPRKKIRNFNSKMKNAIKEKLA